MYLPPLIRYVDLSTLLAHPRRTNFRRVSDPKFVMILTEGSLEPRRVDRRFHTHPSRFGKCGVKLLRLTVLMFQSALDDLARDGIQHCNLLKASVKITVYNYGLAIRIGCGSDSRR